MEGPEKFDRHGSASCTSYPCSGDATRQCGGYDAFSLYYRGECGELAWLFMASSKSQGKTVFAPLFSYVACGSPSSPNGPGGLLL